jgi:hypothetical protein
LAIDLEEVSVPKITRAALFCNLKILSRLLETETPNRTTIHHNWFDASVVK